jgi:hypothetical protein
MKAHKEELSHHEGHPPSECRLFFMTFVVTALLHDLRGGSSSSWPSWSKLFFMAFMVKALRAR